MNVQFAIFGLTIQSKEIGDTKGGEPFALRRYPTIFKNRKAAQDELEIIIQGTSNFVAFNYDQYIIMEV